MTKGKKILILVIVVLFIAAGAFVVYTLLNQDSGSEVILPQVEVDDGGGSNVLPNNNLPSTGGQVDNMPTDNFIKKELTAEEKENAFLTKTSKAFAERFGSYSNQGGYENLVDLKPVMTKKMKAWVDSTIDSGSKDVPDIYYGITTRSLSSSIDVKTTTKAEVLVGTQRQEYVASEVNSKTIYKDILIVFEKEGGVWKVAGAFWK